MTKSQRKHRQEYRRFQRKHRQEYRRFFKLVVLKGCYGRLRKYTLPAGHTSLARAKDFVFVEEILSLKENAEPWDDKVVAYIRDDTEIYGGRPRFNGRRSWFNQWYDRWWADAHEKRYARFRQAQQEARDKAVAEIERITREAIETAAEWARERAEYERELPRRIAEIEARLEREEAEREERRRIAAILAGPKDRATPKGVMAFFQMAEAAQAVNNYIQNQNETNNKTEA